MSSQEKSIRQKQVQNNIQRFLLETFQREGIFEGLKGVYVSVINVDVSRDVKNTTASIDILGKDLSEKQKQQIIKQLNGLAPHLRHMMSKQIKLKYVPNLKFKLSEGSEKALQISQIIKKESDKI